MLNASEIMSLIPKEGSLLFFFTRTKEGQLTVVVDPRYLKSDKSTGSDALKEALSPKTITGSPEMLDTGFMEYLKKTVNSMNDLKEAAEKIDSETKAALDKIKAESSKKVADASKNRSKTSASPVKSTAKSSASPTQAVLGKTQTDDENEGEDENSPSAETRPAETKKEEPKPEVKVPVSLF